MITINIAEHFKGERVSIKMTNGDTWEGTLVAHHPDVLLIDTRSLGIVVLNWQHVTSVRRSLS